MNYRILKNSRINIKIILFCLIFNASYAENPEQPDIKQDIELDIKQDIKSDIELDIDVSKNKNLTAAFDQLRKEKDKLQQDFEILQLKQKENNQLMDENKSLKAELMGFTELKNEVILLKETANRQESQITDLSAELVQKNSGIDAYIEKISVLDAKIADYEAIKPRAYQIKKGDYLPKIVQQQCNGAISWEELYAYNKDIIKNPSRLLIGTNIMLPKECSL
ncbi:hypothetical protein AwWohl_08680 [Gammaproteobacteria bacterium]|nr:hypothetical protein AwWohl_08680 [Gammaproteobacteria bacterium]